MELDVRTSCRSSPCRRSSSTAATTMYVRVGHGRYLAEHIPGAHAPRARAVADHWPLAEPDLLGAIEEFVTGERREIRDTDRVLATVLFMDVVGSTERASELGDEGWRQALDLFERTVRDGLTLYAGT